MGDDVPSWDTPFIGCRAETLSHGAEKRDGPLAGTWSPGREARRTCGRAGDAKLGVDADEFRTRVDDLDVTDRGFHAAETRGAPSSEERSVANFGDGLERHELDPPEQERFVLAGEGRVGNQSGAVDVGVDDDGSPV